MTDKNGELVRLFEQNLEEYLGAKNILFVSNGMLVLQVALKTLKISRKVITTYFTFAAITNAIV
jgi:dTDP-4-amino-4,6-dideoxygalactose transaminase